jgi:alkaline phosphatase D
MRSALFWLSAVLTLPPAPAAPVLVIALDGFRPDYITRYHAPHLRRFAQSGAAARLTPAFPSTTFPNFLTMATGLLPDDHGIVEMDFYDPLRRQRWFYRNPNSTTDASWYSGIPIWVLAEQAHLRAATFFWPGSDAAIHGVRPWFFRPYDSRVTPAQKLAQLRHWLSLDADSRPHLMMLYFPELDSAGHQFGPDSPEVAQAVAAIDQIFAGILDAVAASGIPLDLIVLSDHGMLRVEASIQLAGIADFSGFRVINNLFMVQLYAGDPRRVVPLYRALRRLAPPSWQVYRRQQLPRHLAYGRNPRIGDLLILPTGPYLISLGEPLPKLQGMHGYDPHRFPELSGVFYAAGPSFRPAARLPAFDNRHIHALLARLLGLTPAVELRDRRLLKLLR